MITAKSMSETGANQNLVKRQPNEPNQQTERKPVSDSDYMVKGSDTVTLSETVMRKPATTVDDLNQQDAIALSLLAADGLKNLSYGMTSQAGVDVLRGL